jgi:hypothetical protein
MLTPLERCIGCARGFPTCSLARSFRGSVRASSEDRFDIFRIALWGACLPMSLPEARP